MQPHAIRNEERITVDCQVFGRLAFQQRLGLLQQLIGLQRAVERRHGDGPLAAAEEAVGELADGGDHDCFPQRLSYWTKLGSAFSSLNRPIRLLAMPPR